MRPEPNKRRDTNAGHAGRPGLNAAFGSLQISGLPVGPEPAPVAGPVWKMGKVVLRRETAHRGGKVVTVVDGFATHLPETILEGLAKRLRNACGCGGTLKGRVLEIQGEQVTKLRALLEQEGFEVAGVR